MRAPHLLAVILAFAVWLTGCQRPAPTPEDVVTAFYDAYRGDYREADARLLSRDLAAALQAAATHEKVSAAQTKAGPYPTDKPDIIEGDVFCGLYEGYTGFRIAAVESDPPKAVVEVYFTNSNYRTNWVDEIVLVDQSGWKIDDVLYAGRASPDFGLREVLRDFMAPSADNGGVR